MVQFYLQKYALFPYERRLAEMELEALSTLQPRRHASALSTPPFRFWKRAANRTTYFERVTAESRIVFPIQARLEKSSSRARGRQSTRYSSHGLHDYKGKFNPQVVRAIGNIVGLKPGSRILDPFCGSGTVLVEAVHNGWHADGVDLNPLAIEIAEAKLDVLRAPQSMLHALGDLSTTLSDLRSVGEDGRPFSSRQRSNLEQRARRSASLRSNPYLTSWFPCDVLLQLEIIFAAITELGDQRVERVFRVILSDLLRSVSHQDEADLRVRRRKEPLANAPIIDQFLVSALAKIREVAAARLVLGDCAEYAVRAYVGNSRLTSGEQMREPYDAIITSPPYAMALPYIDTQRLSLATLGLVAPRALARLEGALIGSRDIAVADRRELESGILSRPNDLPNRAARLCQELLDGLGPGDGFRRKNMPALLRRYLLGMQQFLSQCNSYLRPGGHLAMVVGKNETTIGWRRREIDTPSLLADIAENAGYHVVDVIPLDAYQRYGLHAANAIREESLVMIRS